MEESEILHPAVRAIKTICRCNNIKYRTIEKAIREGASSLAQIASKTTATTGHCGGSCTPEVQEMLTALVVDPAPPAAAPKADAGAWWVRKP